MGYDFDVVVIGGGINGLTAAAYLAKAGASVCVVEARAECGAHCDTEEVTLGGFLHNLHATWMITALSPAMEELELEKFGLEILMTDYVYGKTFLDGKCALMGVNPQDTIQNWMRISPKDAEFVVKVGEILIERWDEVLQWVHSFLFEPPSYAKLEEHMKFLEDIAKKMGIDVTPSEVINMNGFQALDIFFESEHIKTMIASLSWIGAFPPLHRKIGSAGCLGIASLTGPIFPVHQVKGGSHSLTHALIRCCKAHGVKIVQNAPVGKILVDGSGKAFGVELSQESIFPGEKITAKKIISDLTLTYTFELIDDERIPPEMRQLVRNFCYDEQVIFGVHYALKEAPVFSSAEFDPGIQKCFMGYFGGETTEEMKLFGAELVSGVIPEKLMANWFVPTLADPSQAPDGYHTAFVWLDVPPIPTRWGKKKLPYSFSIWDKIKWELAEKITELFESYAPGFRKNILDIFVYSPLDVWRNNRSAIKGNWVGGAMVPDQFFKNRPLPGVIVEGATRTFIKDLYLSNSVHPFGATWLASGYLAASEVAQDLGIRDMPWWNKKAVRWYVENMGRIKRNLGVPERWRK